MHLIGIDLDGTLEDSRDDMTAAAGRVRARLGLPARDAARSGPGSTRAWSGCTARASTTIWRKGGHRARRAGAPRVRSRLPEERGGPDSACTTESRMRSRGWLSSAPCAASRTSSSTSRGGCSRCWCRHLFRHRDRGDTCRRPSPDPIMLRAAAERAGFDSTRGRAFMIGDTDGDIELARGFGATSGVVRLGLRRCAQAAPRPGGAPASGAARDRACSGGALRPTAQLAVTMLPGRASKRGMTGSLELRRKAASHLPRMRAHCRASCALC